MVMLLRIGVLAVTVAAAWLLVHALERRGASVRTSGGRSLLLITGASCGMCAPAERALRAHGADPSCIDVGADHGFGRVLALPVAVVTADDGSVVMRRSGRSVIDDAEVLAAAAGPAG